MLIVFDLTLFVMVAFMVLVVIVVFIVIVILIVILVTIVVVLFLIFLLHSFNDLFLNDFIAKYFEKVYGLHILVYGLFANVFYPLVRLAADIDEYVAGRDLNDILSGRLETVKISAVVQEHRQIDA